MSDVAGFYDGLAPEYDCLFGDWWAAARWHAGVVAALLDEHGIRPPAAVLDAACGIGTQALPLAEAGYAVTGTDLSVAAVDRARAEAARRRIDVALSVADMRAGREDRFEAVIACDNALAHLLTDDDLRTALGTLRSCLRPGGLLLASLRDYDALRQARPTGVPLAMHGERGARHAAGQAWTWPPEGDLLDIVLFTLREGADGWQASTHETTVRAWQRQDVTAALGDAGYEQPRWLPPDESGYYQPVVVARNPQQGSPEVP